MMSKQSNILDRISSKDSLYSAWKLLNKVNKTSKGLSNTSIKDFEGNIHKHIEEISKALKSATYTFEKVKGVTIKKKDGKERPLRIPEIKDRLVHKTLSLEFEKLLSTKFKLDNKCSFAYQKGKGIIDAIVQMNIYYREGYTIILEADIMKFFPSVDSISLLKKVKAALPDTSVDDLFDQAMNQELGNIAELENKKVYEDYFSDSESGIPQGNALSPLLANICLSDFDQRMIEEDFKMIRYADDFIIMCKDKKEAKRAYDISLEELQEKLNLTVYPLKTIKEGNEKISRIIDPRATNFSFLSIRFNGTRCWVGDEKIESLISKVKAISSIEERKKNLKEEVWLLQGLVKIKNLLDGWIAAYYFIDIDNQIIDIDKQVNVELYNLFLSFNFTLQKKDLQRVKLKGRSNTRWGLSEIQRKFSGIRSCVLTLRKIRAKKDTLESLIKTKQEIDVLGLLSFASEFSNNENSNLAPIGK